MCDVPRASEAVADISSPGVVRVLRLAFPAYASDESRANLPFVEAVKLIQAAEEEDGAERKLDLLTGSVQSSFCL